MKNSHGNQRFEETLDMYVVKTPQGFWKKLAGNNGYRRMTWSKQKDAIKSALNGKFPAFEVLKLVLNADGVSTEVVFRHGDIFDVESEHA